MSESDDLFRKYQEMSRIASRAAELERDSRLEFEKARARDERYSAIQRLKDFPGSEVVWLSNGHAEVVMTLPELKRMAEFWLLHHPEDATHVPDTPKTQDSKAP